MNKPTYVHNESYMHLNAKQVLKNWFDNTLEDPGSSWKTIDPFDFRSNRASGVWLEYPICVGKDINSWESNWDEIILEQISDYEQINNDRSILSKYKEYVPTYDECVNKFRVYPIAVIDIVITHKGMPKYAIEICHKNPVSIEKKEKLKEIGVAELYEIDASWIMNQTKIPNEIKYRKLI